MEKGLEKKELIVFLSISLILSLIVIILATHPISFTSPTPNNATLQNYNSVFVNVSTNNSANQSAFIDWDRSLVGWWSFESTNTSAGIVYDNSTWGNNGNITNHATNTTVTGMRGSALEFDGVDDYVDVGNNELLNFNSSFSVATWYKTTP